MQSEQGPRRFRGGPVVHLTGQRSVSWHRQSSAFCLQLVPPLPQTPATNEALHLDRIQQSGDRGVTAGVHISPTGACCFYLGCFGEEKSHLWVVVFSGLVQGSVTRLQTDGQTHRTQSSPVVVFCIFCDSLGSLRHSLTPPPPPERVRL